MTKYCMTVPKTTFALKKTNNGTVIDRILHCSEWTSWTVKRGKNLILIGLFFKRNLGVISGGQQSTNV